MEEETVESAAVVNQSVQKIMNLLTQNHGINDSVTVVSGVIACMAAILEKVNESERSHSEHLETILENVSMRARNSTVSALFGQKRQ